MYFSPEKQLISLYFVETKLPYEVQESSLSPGIKFKSSLIDGWHYHGTLSDVYSDWNTVEKNSIGYI